MQTQLIPKEYVKKVAEKSRKTNLVWIFKPLWVWSEPEEELIRSKMIGRTLNLCSGSSDLGDVKVDLYVESDVQADMFRLPFRDKCFDTVIFDPPWKAISDLSKWKKAAEEIIRVVRKRIIIRYGHTMYDLQPKAILKEAWLVKRVSMTYNIIAIWDVVDDSILSYL